MNFVLDLLVSLTDQAPPWARTDLDQLTRLLRVLAGVKPLTALFVLFVIAVGLIFKALVLMTVTMFLATSWLAHKALGTSGETAT